MAIRIVVLMQSDMRLMDAIAARCDSDVVTRYQSVVPLRPNNNVPDFENRHLHADRHKITYGLKSSLRCLKLIFIGAWVYNTYILRGCVK